MKIITLVGTRPEIIRLSEIIKLLDCTPGVSHILVHSNQNYDYTLNGIFFKDLGLRQPDWQLSLPEGFLGERLGSLFSQFDKILESEKPDAMLVLGDTFSCLATILARHRKIPIFHMEAGNRCFDLCVPEETNRRIVDHVSDINLPYSNHARQYLIQEGLPANQIIKTGSPMREVLSANKKRIEDSTILHTLDISDQRFIVCSIHRAESVDDPQTLKGIFDALQEIVVSHNLKAIVTTHPRTKKRLSALGSVFDKRILFIDPLSFSDYNRLQTAALMVLSDSGTISEEASILQFRALNVRNTHERPEAMDCANVTMCGTSRSSIVEAFNVALSLPIPKNNVSDYEDNVSDKIVKIIISYVQYVNTYVYRKVPNNAYSGS